jgi:hypothetical protein
MDFGSTLSSARFTESGQLQDPLTKYRVSLPCTMKYCGRPQIDSTLPLATSSLALVSRSCHASMRAIGDMVEVPLVGSIAPTPSG